MLEPWAHGTVVRATRYPSYFDFNAVRVEEDPAMSVQALIAFADDALAGLAHRRVDVEVIAAAERLRAGFEAHGWTALRLLWMRHQVPLAPGPSVAVEQVPYDAVQDLRVAWQREELPDQDPGQYHAEAREVALRRHAQVFAIRERTGPVAFAELERDGVGAEITQVYVQRDYRGAGCGTALTRAAIEAAGGARDLWIVADDEDRPKKLYARLGFRPAWTAIQFQRMPRAGAVDR